MKKEYSLSIKHANKLGDHLKLINQSEDIVICSNNSTYMYKIKVNLLL